MGTSICLSLTVIAHCSLAPHSSGWLDGDEWPQCIISLRRDFLYRSYNTHCQSIEHVFILILIE